MFFSDRRVAAALEVSSRCPVQRECSADALANCDHGVRGGTMLDDRRAIRQRDVA